jgi:hypothetical protein
VAGEWLEAPDAGLARCEKALPRRSVFGPAGQGQPKEGCMECENSTWGTGPAQAGEATRREAMSRNEWGDRPLTGKLRRAVPEGGNGSPDMALLSTAQRVTVTMASNEMEGKEDVVGQGGWRSDRGCPMARTPSAWLALLLLWQNYLFRLTLQIRPRNAPPRVYLQQGVRKPWRRNGPRNTPIASEPQGTTESNRASGPSAAEFKVEEEKAGR